MRRCSWWRNPDGKARTGCLFTLLVVAALGYYGKDWGPSYFDKWSLKQEIKSLARSAAGLDDGSIHRRLAKKIDDLALPIEAKDNIRIRRTSRPREIEISTSYRIQLPRPFLGPYTWEIELVVRHQL